MTRMKRILPTLLSITLMLSLCSGCGMFTNYKAIAEQALEDKYGEEFICYSTWDEGGDDYLAKLAPAYDESMKFMAAIDTKDKSCYYDKYIEAVVGKQVADIVYQEMDDIWSEYYVRVAINGQGLDITKTDNLSIESYYTYFEYSEADRPHIEIVINDDQNCDIDYALEYEKLLKIAYQLPVEDVSYYLYFVCNDVYPEYQKWFYDNYAIYSNGFQNRTDYIQEIIFTNNKSDNSASITSDDYISRRSSL